MIAVELRKLYRRPRTWVSIVLLCGLPATVAVFLATTRIGSGTGQGPAFLSAVLANGTLFPAAGTTATIRTTIPQVFPRWVTSIFPARSVFSSNPITRPTSGISGSTRRRARSVISF